MSSQEVASRPECERFPAGSVHRDVCEGRIRTPEHCNAHRARWGMGSLVGSPDLNVVAGPSKSSGCCATCGQSTPVQSVQQMSVAKKIAKRMANVTKAAVDFWQDGMAIAIKEQQQHRESVCAGCPLNKSGWCDLGMGGCGCKLDVKIKARASFCPLGRWFDHNDTYRPLVNPTRNLIFHIYPKRSAEWNWVRHLENIQRVAPLFNGKIAIGIVTGDGLAKPDDVQRALSGVPVTDWVIRHNNANLAETSTFQDLLACVHADDPNTVTFRGHTKGVTHMRDSIEQEWARLMWAACMDLQSVDDALASHVMAGPMKCHEPLHSTQKYKWFYAGTFFWFRNKEIFERNWRTMESTRWYPEAWPGMIATNEEAASLCHDFTDGSVLSAEYWQSVVAPNFEAWKRARPNRIVELE
jgi:hypothetical protein